MAIRARGNSFQIDVTFGGRRIREAFPTHAEAKARVLAIKSGVELGSPGSPVRPLPAPTLARALDDEYKRSWGRTANAAGTRSGIKALNSFFGGKRLDTIETGHLVDFANHLADTGVGPATINKRLNLISKVLRTAAHQGKLIMPKIPRRREQETRPGWLEPNEVNEIARQMVLTYGRDDMSAYVHFLANTGLRPSEALRAVPSDIVDGFLHVSATKTGKFRSIPLNEKAAAAAKHLPFKFKYRDFVSRWALIRKAMGKVADPEFVPYILRHTFATRLLQKGADITQVRDLLGHTSIQQTLRYAKVAPKDLVSAVNLI